MSHRILEIREELKHLRSILASGATEIAEDGQVTKFDSRSAIEKTIRNLENELRAAQGKRRRRPILGDMDLSGRW